MAEVVLGPAGSSVLVDLETCAKSGRPTDERVTFRGSTSPGWVNVLLLFTIIGFLFASAMTSRRFEVTLPFVHEIRRRWVRNRRLAWAGAVAGVALVVAGVSIDGDATTALVLGGLAVVAVSGIAGLVSSLRHGIGFRTTRDDDLVVTGVHRDFARAVRTSRVEPTTR